MHKCHGTSYIEWFGDEKVNIHVHVYVSYKDACTREHGDHCIDGSSYFQWAIDDSNIHVMGPNREWLLKIPNFNQINLAFCCINKINDMQFMSTFCLLWFWANQLSLWVILNEKLKGKSIHKSNKFFYSLCVP